MICILILYEQDSSGFVDLRKPRKYFIFFYFNFPTFNSTVVSVL